MSTPPPRWVIQTNLLGARHLECADRLAAFLEQQGVAFQGLEVVPFDSAPLDVAADRPTVFWGSTRLVERVVADGRFRPGVWYDAAATAFPALHAAWGDELANADSVVTTIGDLVDSGLHPDGEVFVRPVEDFKEFSGRVYRGAELPELLVYGSRSRATRATRVQVARPKRVGREWRTIVVDGQVVTGSAYCGRHGLLSPHDQAAPLPDDVVRYAQARVAQYAPVPVFVLDVWEVGDAGRLAVGEVNCFNCAGLYGADCYLIAQHVTAAAVRAWYQA